MAAQTSWRVTRSLAAIVAVALAALAIDTARPIACAQPLRRDIVAAFSSGTVLIQVGDQSATATITDGSLSLSTDDARCVPESGIPCIYTINELRLFTPGFTVLGQSFENVRLLNSEPAPKQLDDGTGIRVRPVMPFWVLGRTAGDDFGVFTVPEEGDALDIFDLVVTPSENRATVFGRITGRIERHTVRLTIMASVDSPFENVPPVADAGPDVSATTSCVAELDFDGSSASDSNGNLRSSWWAIDARAVGSASAPVVLPPGEYDLTLFARDTYGGLGRDVTHVSIADDGRSEPREGMELVRFEVPAGTDPEHFALVGAERLAMQPGSSALSEVDRGAPIASLGEMVLGVDSHVGESYAAASAVLRNRAWIEGALFTDGDVVRGRDVRIDGGVIRGPILPGRETSFHVPAPPPDAADVLVTAGEHATLGPGTYGNVVVEPRARLELAPGGVYSMQTLRVAPRAEVISGAEVSGAPTIVAVTSEVQHHGRIVPASDAAPWLLIAYLGLERWFVHAPFTGWIVAPNAALVLRPGEHRGAFVARDVTLLPFASVAHHPLSWEFVRQARASCAVEPRFECVRDLGDGGAVARFGYSNRLPHYGAVVPVGPFNRLIGAPAAFPPQGFWPREVTEAFEVEIEDEVSWILGGRIAVATREGTPCAD